MVFELSRWKAEIEKRVNHKNVPFLGPVPILGRLTLIQGVFTPISGILCQFQEFCADGKAFLG